MAYVGGRNAINAKSSLGFGEEPTYFLAFTMARNSYMDLPGPNGRTN